MLFLLKNEKYEDIFCKIAILFFTFASANVKPSIYE